MKTCSGAKAMGLLTAVAILASAAGAAAQPAPAAPQGATFDPKPQQIMMHPGQGAKTFPITLTYHGWKPQKPLEIVPVSRDKWDRSTPDAAMRGIVAANEAGDADWIVALFVPAERNDIRKIMKEPGAMDRNTEYARSVKKTVVHEVVLYGDFALVIFEEVMKAGGSRFSELPMRKAPEGWLMTNALEKDVVFTFVIEAIRRPYEKR